MERAKVAIRKVRIFDWRDFCLNFIFLCIFDDDLFFLRVKFQFYVLTFTPVETAEKLSGKDENFDKIGSSKIVESHYLPRWKKLSSCFFPPLVPHFFKNFRRPIILVCLKNGKLITEEVVAFGWVKYSGVWEFFSLPK